MFTEHTPRGGHQEMLTVTEPGKQAGDQPKRATRFARDERRGRWTTWDTCRATGRESGSLLPCGELDAF